MPTCSDAGKWAFTGSFVKANRIRHVLVFEGDSDRDCVMHHAWTCVEAAYGRARSLWRSKKTNKNWALRSLLCGLELKDGTRPRARTFPANKSLRVFSVEISTANAFEFRIEQRLPAKAGMHLYLIYSLILEALGESRRTVSPPIKDPLVQWRDGLE